ncbi:MAG: GNAT family N-acetyltransferase [Gemmatimonadaceae bacterium]
MMSKRMTTERALTATPLLRRARADDVLVYFEWTNDSEVRRNSFSARAISLDEHQNWFSRKLGSPDAVMLVLEADSRPLGQIRFDVDGRIAIIGFSLSSAARGKGLGSYLLREGMSLLRDSHPDVLTVRGLVKADNTPSQRTFVAAGFRCVSKSSESDVTTLVYETTLEHPGPSNA